MHLIVDAPREVLQRRAGRAGFTLIEILLVVVIIGIAAAVALPTFARSFRGAKLRNSTRLVLAMHRNAQNKAVLNQGYMAVLFDLRKNTIELVEQGKPARKQDGFFGELGGGGGMGQIMTGADGEIAVEAPTSKHVRKMDDGVKMISFRGGKDIDELFYVNYYPNGHCEAFEVVIGDDENRRTRIKVNPVTGKAKVTNE